MLSVATSQLTFEQAITTVRANTGATIAELSQKSPILVVFLRHSGCPFCRQALHDISQQRERIEKAGLKIVLVHMTSELSAAKFFGRYYLGDVSRISDPEKQLYNAFELQRGSLWQLFGPAIWWRGAQAFFGGHGAGAIEGDSFQMPGTFVVHRSQILKAFRHVSQADRPDYANMAETCSLND
jgi:peroxiredoxin